MSWTLQFQQDDLPTIVVSGQFKSSPDCYFAVGYGVPIVSEQWLYNLTNRLRACWKKIADSVDSFTLPDSADPALRPPYDPSLRNAPANPGFWITRPANRTLFVGWRVVGLKAARVSSKRSCCTFGAH